MNTALASSQYAVPFNAVFYATIATIIPLFFLAIAVQGRLYEDLIKVVINALEWPRAAKNFRQALVRAFPSWVAGCVLLFLMAAILVSGTSGDIQAILALTWQRPVGDPSAAVQGVILLTMVVGIGPVLLVEKHFGPLVRRDLDKLQALKRRAVLDNSDQAAESTAEEQVSSVSAEAADEPAPSADSAS